MDISNLKLYAAPLQGFTERPWREAHATIAGGVDEYFAPFSRVEKGAVRSRDVREVAGEQDVVGQAIFRDADELRLVVESLTGAGVRKIDLNLGCPFPPQVKKGRGAAMIERPDELLQASAVMAEFPEVKFSAKMRLGVSDCVAWRGAIDAINAMPLRMLTVHPRVAVQQYSGDLHFDEFAALLEESRHPVVFNGDIVSAEDISRVADRFPAIEGVMVGRGLLARPLLAREWRSGQIASDAEQLTAALAIHDLILAHYRATLCGDSQILQKIKPYWTYLAPILPHRTAKALHKSRTLDAYLAEVKSLGFS